MEANEMAESWLRETMLVVMGWGWVIINSG